MKKILSKIKKHGLSKSVSILLKKILNIEINKMLYMKLEIDLEKLDQAMKDFNVQVKNLSYDDFLLGDVSVFEKEKLELIHKKLNDDNYQAYGIIENNKLIYSTWISLKKISLPLVSSQFLLLPSEGLLEDSYCDVTARGRGFHSKMNNYRIKKLSELQKDKVIAIVLKGNEAAFKVQKRSGFEVMGSFYCGKFFGIKFCNLKKVKYENQ